MAPVLSELRAAMARLRESMWSQMKTIEGDLRKDPLPQSLLPNLWNAESQWSKIEKCRSNFPAAAEGEEDRNERLACNECYAYYINVNE